MTSQAPFILTGAVPHQHPGGAEHVPHGLGIGELGKVAGASWDDVVQQQRLMVAAAVGVGGIDGARHLDVVRCPADTFPQAQQDRG